MSDTEYCTLRITKSQRDRAKEHKDEDQTWGEYVTGPCANADIAARVADELEARGLVVPAPATPAGESDDADGTRPTNLRDLMDTGDEDRACPECGGEVVRALGDPDGRCLSCGAVLGVDDDD
jgi:hypothetical protein